MISYEKTQSRKTYREKKHLCHLQRLTAIIQSSLKDSPLCIGIHVTALYLYVMNNAVIIMFLKMCYYYYSFYIYIYLNNVIYLFNAINCIYLALV